MSQVNELSSFDKHNIDKYIKHWESINGELNISHKRKIVRRYTASFTPPPSDDALHDYFVERGLLELPKF